MSDQSWTEPGAYPVADGVHRIPLPLPMDGLRAVNVYVLETDDGLVVVDGGWAVPESRAQFDLSLKDIGPLDGGSHGSVGFEVVNGLKLPIRGNAGGDGFAVGAGGADLHLRAAKGEEGREDHHRQHETGEQNPTKFPI